MNEAFPRWELPLKNITVIDFTQAYSGPFCTMQLADFGAEVIKIERVGTGDQSREWSPICPSGSGYFAAVNRVKKGIALDLTTKEGGQIAKKLIGRADILVENFKTGTMEKLGLDYDSVAAIKPDIIYASITGFGDNTSLKELAAYDNIIQAMSGIMEMTGFPDREPVRIGPAIGDSFTGLNAALAILLAYFHKMKTGEGQKINVAMMDTIFSMLESPILFQTLLGKEVRRSGNSDPETLVPYDVYECADGFFSVGIPSDAGWPRFCKAVDMPALQNDPRFFTNEDRCRNYSEFTETVSGFFRGKTRKELTDIFVNAGVACGAVLSVPELTEDPQLKARDMLVPMTDPNGGAYLAIGDPMKLSKTPPYIKTPSPRLGEHTREILLDLGYTLEELRAFAERKAIQFI